MFGFQEDHSADICSASKNSVVKGIREMGQMSSQLKLKVLKCGRVNRKDGRKDHVGGGLKTGTSK